VDNCRPRYFLPDRESPIRAWHCSYPWPRRPHRRTALDSQRTERFPSGLPSSRSPTSRTKLDEHQLLDGRRPCARCVREKRFKVGTIHRFTRFRSHTAWWIALALAIHTPLGVVPAHRRLQGSILPRPTNRLFRSARVLPNNGKEGVPGSVAGFD